MSSELVKRENESSKWQSQLTESSEGVKWLYESLVIEFKLVSQSCRVSQVSFNQVSVSSRIMSKQGESGEWVIHLSESSE